jgi:hypothetical protein
MRGLARVRLNDELAVVADARKETMKKTVSLFARNYDGDRLVRDEIVPGAEWVAAGEGVATRKHDGTCCMVRGGKLFKRFDAKAGKVPPANFEPAQPEPDANTGHWPGWVPVGDGPEDARHREAFSPDLSDGTYELCGPKVQSNPEGYSAHVLIRHGCEVLDAPRTFDALRDYLTSNDIEGIVWHHPDGRMVKIKGKDFGIRRKAPQGG